MAAHEQEERQQQHLAMRRQLSQFASALTSFSSSPSTFRILTSISPSNSSLSPPPPPSTLYVLDSSFNPPTLAHLRIATSALTQDTHGGPLPTRRLILLLATQNADKAPRPASFEQRLMLMTIFAQDLLRSLSASSHAVATTSPPVPATTTDTPEHLPTIDIALTTHPFFVSKAAAISQSGSYPANITQIHLTGYDTLIRILDPKYYLPTHTLAPLGPFLDKHRLRVTYRTGDGWAGWVEQDGYLKALERGDREGEGGRREWAGRIELVEGRKEGEEVVSSTRVREAARKGDGELLRRLLSESVADWVLKEKLYTDGTD